MLPRSTLFVALVAASACDTGRQANPVRDAYAAAPRADVRGVAVAFRFPSDGSAQTRLYQLPDLEPVAWRFESGSGRIRTVVGFAEDEDQIYALNAARELIALDLSSGRVSTVDTGVALATLGPTGTPHVVHRDGTVATVQRRRVTPWEARFDSLPRQIWGAARSRFIAEVETVTGRELWYVARDRPTVTHRLPRGMLSVAPWGDVAAVATDSGLYVLEPANGESRRFLPMPRPTMVTFSPSAHRMYVATADGTLRTIERFDLIVLDTLKMPGAIESGRVDPLGRFLLARPAGQDSVWTIDLLAWRQGASYGGTWSSDLPAVARDGTLLLRDGDRVSAIPLNRQPARAQAAGSGDRWLPVSWDPRRPALELTAQTSRQPETGAGQLVYVQVSSTQNPEWAAEFARNLQRAGVLASVLPPSAGQDFYRVVLGPYPNREEAEGTAQKLGLPFWIFSADSTSQPGRDGQF